MLARLPFDAFHTLIVAVGACRRLKEQQGRALRIVNDRAAMCTCCSKAALAPMDAPKPLRSPVKMWISAAVDDSEVLGLPWCIQSSERPTKQGLCEPETMILLALGPSNGHCEVIGMSRQEMRVCFECDTNVYWKKVAAGGCREL